MRAAVFGDTGQIGVVQKSPPEPKPGWVRLAVTASGICGSDLNLLYAHGNASVGVQPGHEVAGIVDALGDGLDGASGPTLGSPVALEPLIGCGHCNACRRGRHNLCPSVRLCGFTRPGGMAEYLVVPADAVHAVPDSLPAHIAALSEPMAVCVRGVRLARLSPGDRVAILGAGSIGLLAIVAARSAGASEVLITARHPHQQALARSLGADAVFADTRELLDAVGDQHVDVTIETVGGHATTLADTIAVTRSGGRVVVLGVFEGMAQIPGFEFFRKELSLLASNCYGRECAHGDFAAAADLVGRERDRLAPLVTHRFKLDQIAEAFATAADKTTLSIKVQVQP
ncbi:MAG: alcohol dehydrogenase catalytic domain-containing protein [Pseudomonadales bacterium]